MAVAPLNKFINISVPVAPGEQVVYTTPTGVSSIVLFAQVANVAKGEQYPEVTCLKRRKSRLGNSSDIRIVKGARVYPNDTLVIIDGRYVLEKSAFFSDLLVVHCPFNNVGIRSITDCDYDTFTGITTVTTTADHDFVVGDEITMAGLAFTCFPGSGITTSIFPSPQITFTVTDVPLSNVFVTNAGVGAGITHFYQPNTGLVAPVELEFSCSILENSIV